VSNNAIVLRNKKISAVARSGSFRYKLAPLTVAKGTAEVDINTIEVDIGISFSTTTLPSGHVVPHFRSVDVKCNINRFDINIKLTGDFIVEFASIFEVIFVGTVAGLLEDSINVALNTTVPGLMNALVDKSNGVIPLPMNWALDYQTPDPVVISTTKFAMGMKALFFDRIIGEEEPTTTIPYMPYWDLIHPDLMQLYVSAYTMDSLFGSITEVTDLKGWLRASTSHVTTTMLNTLLPGIVSKYGGGQPVDIWF
jgi:hypothetical protein